jgi:phosphonate transport system ATP-binding protein
VTILDIRGLGHSYNGGAPVLRGVSFKVEQGEFVGIIGLSGAGKSTLLRCINRLVQAGSGEVLVPRGLLAGAPDGALIDVLQLDAGALRHLRRRIGMIFQQFNLAKRLSVIDNVLCGGLGYQPALRSTLRIFSRDERRRALANLKRVGLLEHAYKRADELSGGEQQRVAIARAIAKRPAVLLCDEPTGALDISTGVVVLEALARVNAELGTTTVVITHNAAIASMSDRVIRLADGRVVAVEERTERLSPRELAW